MTRGPASVSTWLGVSMLALAGCTETVAIWSPEGTDATIAGRWSIAGGPADATTCAAAGVDEVDLVFVHDGDDVVIGTFTFQCMQAAFDSRPVAALAAGTYSVLWRFTGRSDAGTVTFETSEATIVATPGGHVDVPAGDFAPPP